MTLAGSIGIGTATAAELDGVVTDITVSPSVVDPGGRIRTDMSFCIPDWSASGDSFAVNLPAELTQLPEGITLRDPAGAVVANASIAGTPAVATFTFTTYVDERIDVCGSAFFESDLSSTVAPNAEIQLRFVISGGAIIDEVITTGERVVGTNRTTARKSAAFDDVGDQCRTTLDSCIQWFIESRPGPLASVDITDDGLTNAVFECDTFSVRFWTLTPDGSRDTEVPAASIGSVSSTCTADSLSASITGVPDGVIVRARVNATPSTADAEGDVTFTNAASVTHVSESTVVDDVIGRVRSSLAGGEASGAIPPPTTTTTTTTTVAPTTTTAASTTTTTVAGAAATTTAPTTTVAGTVATTTTSPVGGSGVATPTSPPVRLPATGAADGSLAVVAFGLVLAGVGMIIWSRRLPA